MVRGEGGEEEKEVRVGEVRRRWRQGEWVRG